MKDTKRILEWHEELASGDVSIDGQTKKFLRHANEFLDNRNSIYVSDKLDGFLGFLTDFSREHFPLQETVMKEVSYPSTLVHIDEHRGFIKQVSKLYKQVLIQKKPRVQNDIDYDERGVDGVVNDTCDFIISWYDSHMFITDKRLYDYFKYEYTKRDK